MTCSQFILFKYIKAPLMFEVIGVFDNLEDTNYFLYKLASLQLPESISWHPIFGFSYTSILEEGIIWVAYEVGYPEKQDFPRCEGVLIEDGESTPQDTDSDDHGDPWRCLCEICENKIINTNTMEFVENEYPDITVDDLHSLLTEKLETLQSTFDIRSKIYIMADIYKVLHNNTLVFFDEMFFGLMLKITEIFSSSITSKHVLEGIIAAYYRELIVSLAE